MLYTERLLLRPFEEGDAPALFLIANDPAVGPAAGWEPHPDVGHSRMILRTVLQVPETYALCLRSDGTLIGSISLFFPGSCNLTIGQNDAELRAWIGKAYWGQGYITEAAREMIQHGFEDLRLSRIYGAAFSDNAASARLQEKLGFRYRYTKEHVWWEPLQEEKTIIVQAVTNPEYVI